jgi:hypothetical protein
MKVLFFLAKTMLVIGATTSCAHAYLEPGVVSMLLQGLVAGLMVVATTIGIYWQKFLSIVHKITGKEVSDGEASEAESADSADNDGEK